MTLEFLAQLPYTGLGLGLYLWLQPDTQLGGPVALGLAIAAVAAAAFVVAQRRGLNYVDRIAAHLGAGWAERSQERALNRLRCVRDRLPTVGSLPLSGWMPFLALPADSAATRR